MWRIIYSTVWNKQTLECCAFVSTNALLLEVPCKTQVSLLMGSPTEPYSDYNRIQITEPQPFIQGARLLIEICNRSWIITQLGQFNTHSLKKKKTTLHGPSPRANYTDQATTEYPLPTSLFYTVLCMNTCTVIYTVQVKVVLTLNQSSTMPTIYNFVHYFIFPQGNLGPMLIHNNPH
jgi:hypothetical protein